MKGGGGGASAMWLTASWMLFSPFTTGEGGGCGCTCGMANPKFKTGWRGMGGMADPTSTAGADPCEVLLTPTFITGVDGMFKLFTDAFIPSCGGAGGMLFTTRGRDAGGTLFTLWCRVCCIPICPIFVAGVTGEMFSPTLVTCNGAGGACRMRLGPISVAGGVGAGGMFNPTFIICGVDNVILWSPILKDGCINDAGMFPVPAFSGAASSASVAHWGDAFTVGVCDTGIFTAPVFTIPFEVGGACPSGTLFTAGVCNAGMFPVPAFKVPLDAGCVGPCDVTFAAVGIWKADMFTVPAFTVAPDVSWVGPCVTTFEAGVHDPEMFTVAELLGWLTPDKPSFIKSPRDGIRFCVLEALVTNGSVVEILSVLGCAVFCIPLFIKSPRDGIRFWGLVGVITGVSDAGMFTVPTFGPGASFWCPLCNPLFINSPRDGSRFWGLTLFVVGGIITGVCNARVFTVPTSFGPGGSFWGPLRNPLFINSPRDGIRFCSISLFVVAGAELFVSTADIDVPGVSVFALSKADGARTLDLVVPVSVLDIESKSKQPNEPVPALDRWAAPDSASWVKSFVPPNTDAVNGFFREKRFIIFDVPSLSFLSVFFVPLDPRGLSKFKAVASAILSSFALLLPPDVLESAEPLLWELCDFKVPLE